MNKILIPVFICFIVTGCATLKPQSFEKSQVKLDPVAFFVGHTKSYGVLESRSGKPSTQITTETMGTLKDGKVFIEQDLYPGNGEKNHRSWQINQVDEHHVEATANDIDGIAHGELYGNYFTWTFRLKVKERKFIKHVRMSQYMYLMPDGQTLIIRSVIKKFGIIVTQITEEFKKV